MLKIYIYIAFVKLYINNNFNNDSIQKEKLYLER